MNTQNLPVIASVILVAAVLSSQLAAQETPSPSFEDRVMELVNQERWDNGQLTPLKRDALLDDSSEVHSSNQAVRNFFAHCDPDLGAGDRLPWDRMEAAGYNWSAAAENIAAGYSTPELVVDGWMNSPGHRANILSTSFRELGIGHLYQSSDQGNVRTDTDGNCVSDSFNHGPYYHYWTQNFGTRNNIYPVVIDREAYETSSRQVDLYLYGAGVAVEMRIRNENEPWTEWEPFVAQVDWELSADNGVKEVLVEIVDSDDTIYGSSDTILLDGITPPKGVAATDGTFVDAVKITWNPVTDATEYEIYRADSPEGTKSLLDTTSGTSYDDFAAVPGATHYYWVTACDTDSCSDFSDYDAGNRADIQTFSGHVGQVAVDHQWQPITFPTNFQAPVVIAGPPTYHGADPSVVRLDNVTGTGFDIRLQEWLYRDGSHVYEDISFLVLEEGRHELPDGSIWEVGTFNLDGTGDWRPQSFAQAFPGTPALFLTVQSFTGHQPITARVRQLDTSGFEAALFEEENLMDGHLGEIVGYLAIYDANGWGAVDLGEETVPYLLQQPDIDHRFIPVLSHTLKLEEEQSRDEEITHVPEEVDVLALGSHLFAQVVTSHGMNTVALRRLFPEYVAPMEWGVVDGVNHDWTRIPLTRAYTNPVIVTKAVSSNGVQAGVIRLRQVTGETLELRFQEWNYLDGSHADEQVFYLVAQQGIHTLAGLTVEARRLDTDVLAGAGEWRSVFFNTPFESAPVLLTGVQTYNGSDTVTTQVDLLTNTSFDLAMDEQESKNDGHVNEILGWIAVEIGAGTTQDNRRIIALGGLIDQDPTVLSFGETLDRAYPVVVSDANTTNEPDPVFLRYRNPAPDSIELYLQEEQSLDAEITHFAEDVGLFVAE